FAVKYRPDGVVFVRDRLAAGRQIDDTEAGVRQPQRAVAMETEPIRSSMGNSVNHALQLGADHRCPGQIEDARYATHVDTRRCGSTGSAARMKADDPGLERELRKESCIIGSPQVQLRDRAHRTAGGPAAALEAAGPAV